MEWLELIEQSRNIMGQAQILAESQSDESGGLTLTVENCRLLILTHRKTLKEYSRIETGKGMLEELLSAFSDSKYISQTEYAEILMELQEVFCWLKNETEDTVNDEDCLQIMKDFYEHEAAGSIALLYDCLSDWMEQSR